MRARLCEDPPKARRVEQVQRSEGTLRVPPLGCERAELFELADIEGCLGCRCDLARLLIRRYEDFRSKVRFRSRADAG